MIAAVIATVALILTAQPAVATPTPPGIAVTADPYFARDSYDYGASIIDDGGIRRIWWCGQVPGATDVILYRTQNLATGVFSAVQTVLAPNPSVATWDRSYICDPSVIAGQFVNPDNGVTYGYAMYYTATDRGPGTPYAGTNLDGSNNRIGIAYSNDGVTWSRYSANPIIYPATYPTDTYGAGQGATYNETGYDEIRLTYTDFSVPGQTGERLLTRTTTDGRTFGAYSLLSLTGLPNSSVTSIGNGDIAFDYTGRYWYAAFAYGYSAPQGFRSGDRERYQFGLYRMPEATFPGGTWEHLGFVDTNLTGATLNHNTSLVRDRFGNVNATTPSIQTVFSRGTNDPGSWDFESVVTPADPTGVISPLNRYRSGSGAWQTTTGYVQPGYSFNAALGDLYVGMKPGTAALYGCRAGSNDYFVTRAADCEGQYVLGVNGFLYPTQPATPATVPLYRCYGSSGHYAVNTANCGSDAVESLLGYVLAPDSAASVAQGGFETPAVTGFAYTPSGSAWSFVGTSGIQRNGSAFGASAAPEGQQTALLQSGPSGLGSVTQSVTLDAGTYRVSFSIARRGTQVQPVQVKIDGVAVGSPITPAGSAFQQVVTVPFTVTSGSHTLQLSATNTAPDLTSFVDLVAVTP